MEKKWINLAIAGAIVAAIMIASSLVSSATRTTPAIHEMVLNSFVGSAVSKEVVAEQLGESIRRNQYPESFAFDIRGVQKEARVNYTLHEPSQSLMRKLLSQYKPDYGAFVAIDAKTGRILTMVSQSRLRPELDNLNLRATFPAASIFKVITAGAAIDLDKAGPETVVPFNGALHTLHKRNLQDNRQTRWTRRMTLRQAFAKSVNTFFGKLGLFYVGPQNLHMYAERFLFNHPIPADIPVQTGYARFSQEDPFSVASAASGFTRETTMSPLHGAMIAAAVANDGIMMQPYLVDKLQADDGRVLYEGEQKQVSIVVEPKAAEELRDLFHETVRAGTSRKSFRKTVRRSIFEDVEFGGKTGSLTGGDPFGKVDWFVGYARYRGERIAVAALTVNEKKWRVKSSMLASLYFQNHLKDLIRAQSLANYDRRKSR